MKLIQTSGRRRSFDVMAQTTALQACSMLLRPGGTSDDKPSNEHPNSEQWLFVVGGDGSAVIVPKHGRKRTVKLKVGSLLIIQRGERHQIRATGRKVLRTINFYVPPAYTARGELRRS